MPALEFIGKGSMPDEDASKQTAIQNAVYQMTRHMSANKCYHVVIGRAHITEFPKEGVTDYHHAECQIFLSEHENVMQENGILSARNKALESAFNDVREKIEKL